MSVPRRRRYSAPRRSLRAAITVLITLVLAVPTMIGLAGAAGAAPVYQITGQWAPNTPAAVAKGDVVTGVWRVNVNDDKQAPANDPVDNVTFTVTLQHGTFKALPDACQTSDVDPASSISADGTTLTCNLGTQKEGTAVVVQAPVVVDGATGDEVSATGAIDGHTADLPPIAIDNPFAMDMLWGQPSNQFTWHANSVDIDFEWTLNLAAGADAGPDSVTYNLTITDDNSSAINVAPQACAAFTAGGASGHPWSGGDHPATRVAPFVDSCSLTKNPNGTFTLTLTGIDYSQAQVPTQDSTGTALPTDQVAVASGSIWLRVLTTANDTVNLSANAPTYTSQTGHSANDDTSNNTSNKNVTQFGGFSETWSRGYTGAGGSPRDDTYRVSPGTLVQSAGFTGFGALDAGTDPDSPYGLCQILDTRYVTYDGWSATFTDPATRTVQYYTGNAASVTPGSGSYNPNAFDCGTTGGWTGTEPADKSTVKAVRVVFPFRDLPDHNVFLAVQQRIHGNVAPGQDIWVWGSYREDGGAWINPLRATDGSAGVTATPNARYPYTSGGRDILRIVALTPSLSKSVANPVVKPGVPDTYSLDYAANGAGATGTVDGYQVVDTLPAGMSYVPGSSSGPEPAVNGQTLTWTLDAVPTNAVQHLTYQAVAADSVTPGQTLTNSAVATVQGTSSQPATADVTVSTAGFTMIAKSADSTYIPNVDGDGVGAGSWTVTLTSQDPTSQAWTDTIDILPYNGDGRGTSFSGSYTLQEPTAVTGATVYYTSADPATLSDDPGDPSNGSPGDPTGSTVGWSSTYTADATAIRVIGPALAPGATQQFTVPVTTNGAVGGDTFVNRAQARTEHTQLPMRTSATLTVANYYSAQIKKYVQDAGGAWHDANDTSDYPAFHYGDTIHYRIVVTNTGQGTLTDVDITDDQNPSLGDFHVDSLAAGESTSHEYAITLGDSVTGSLVNTACGSAATPPDSQVPPTINCDPAGFDVTNYTTVKTADPESGSAVAPGETIHYTITVTQQGSAPADAVFTDDLTDVLDDATYNNDAHASLGTVTKNGDALDWSGTVPVGGTATVTYSVTVNSPETGNTDLLNPVTSPGCVTAASCRTDHKTGDFIYSKVADPETGTPVGPGQKITYTIEITQQGAAAVPSASVTDDLTDVLDDATYGKDAKATSGTVSYTAPTLSWKGNLAAGQTVRITYTVTVTGAGSDDLVNPVTSTDKRGSCDTSVGCRTEHPIGDYSYDKVADPTSGSTVGVGKKITYTLRITQQGKAAVPNATVTDDLSKVLDDATYDNDVTASGGTVSYASPHLVWRGDLAVGQTVTITYSVTVTGNGDHHLANIVSTTDKRGVCDITVGCSTEHNVPDPVAASSSSALASTGTDNRLGLILAGLLVAAGGLLTVTARRRRDYQPRERA